MSDEFISLKALAAELCMDRSHARCYVLRLGVKPQKRRTPESGGQLTLTVSASEAEFVKSRRNEQGFLDSAKEGGGLGVRAKLSGRCKNHSLLTTNKLLKKDGPLHQFDADGKAHDLSPMGTGSPQV